MFDCRDGVMEYSSDLFTEKLVGKCLHTLHHLTVHFFPPVGCVCVWREKERERGREGGREGGPSTYMYVHVPFTYIHVHVHV